MAKKESTMEDSRMQTATQTQSRCPAVSIDQPLPRMPARGGRGVWSHFLANVFTLLLFSPLVANATLSIPVSEDDLAQYATAIVVGQVKEIESYWDDNAKQVFTHITVTVQEVLKGDVNDSEFTVKQLGGKLGHLRSWVEGSPEFVVGEKVLLFLDTNPDGSACVAHLYQGKFSVFTDRDTGKEFAYRGDTPNGVRLLTGTKTARAQTASTANEFQELAALKAQIRNALTSASSGESRASLAPLSALTIPPGSAAEKQVGFVVIGPPSIRWFEPDSGTPVTMSINPNNILPTGEEQIDAGFRAWNAVPQSTFRFAKGAATTSGGFTTDSVNAISFNDPLSQLPDPVKCTGILAATLHVTSDEHRTLQEQTFFRIVKADVVFANGWDNCTAFKTATNIAEIATHELGHVLGLGHSLNPDATMFALAHFDGRGAALRPDDESGVAFLYPDASFPPCTYVISPTKRSLAGGATSGKVAVSTRDGCGWTAASVVPWITIAEGVSSSGTGTVVYTVEANSAKTARRGALLVAGKTFIITQRGATTPRQLQPPFAR